MQIPPTPKGSNLNRVFIAIALAIIFQACSERFPEPVILPDSTIVYPAKDSNDISAKITFSRFLGQKSGKQSAICTVFPLNEDENIYAVVDLENFEKNAGKSLMFHLDWIGPDGNSFYMKHIDILPGDTDSALVSSIKISTEKRVPGRYKLRVYLSRELIAEKYFELKNESEIAKPASDIIFYKNIDKETGAMNGVDTVFEIKKKGILRAKIDLSGIGIYKDEELPFRMEWIGPDGESFYSKKNEIKQADSLSTITGSISITPDKRQPGEYFLRVYLFDEMVGERRFILTSEE